MKIATWNICCGIKIKEIGDNYFDQEKEKCINDDCFNEIVFQINKNKIEVIALQEVITSKSLHYLESLSQKTELKYFEYFTNSPCNLVENTEFGIAIMSKYPIKIIKKELFDNPKLTFTTKSGTYGSHDKGFMVCEIIDGNEKIKICTTQFLPFHRFGTDIVSNKKLFVEFDNYMHSENVIACGDFNCVLGKQIIKEILPQTAKSHKFLFDKITTIDNKKCDNILLPKQNVCKDTQLIKSCSDHYLCIADVLIKQ